jgi:hypothetical protein
VSYHCYRFPMLILLTGVLSLPSVAVVSEPDLSDTTKALNALLAISNERIPPSSSCFARYGQRGKPTVKDILATQFAVFYRGENIIEGNCKDSKCKVLITHSAGEDVSSATIEFRLKHQHADVRSLKCLMTP